MTANSGSFRPALTKSQEESLCDQYISGTSCTSLASSFAISRRTAYRILERHGVERRPVDANRLFDRITEINICASYERGNSVRRIADQYNAAERRIYHILERNDIARRSRKKYQCNDSFFDSIDTEAKAYWLGFITADGFISARSSLIVCLSSSDKLHLERLKSTLHSNHPIGQRASRKDKATGYEFKASSVLAIWSKPLTASLRKHGATYRKTFTTSWPNFLPTDLLRHYLRGYFDGDGCLHLSKKGQAHFSMTGATQFLRDCQAYLVTAAGVNFTKLAPHRTSEGIADLRYGGNRQTVRIAHLIYDDATIYLPRKYDKVAHLL